MDAEMKDYIAKIRREVNEWPEWKKNLLADSVNPYWRDGKTMSDSDKKRADFEAWAKVTPYGQTPYQIWQAAYAAGQKAERDSIFIEWEGADALTAEVERLSAKLAELKADRDSWRRVCEKETESKHQAWAELAAAKAASVCPVNSWQSMETAPKDGTTILLATTLRVAESSWGVCRPQWDGYVANEGKPCWRASGEEKVRGGDPLYWMPMPLYSNLNGRK